MPPRRLAAYRPAFTAFAMKPFPRCCECLVIAGWNDDAGVARRPRRHVHFTPTSASWLNQVEHFFADLTEKQIRRGVHRPTVELEQAITQYIDAVNEDPKPFRWHKSADEILACIKRFYVRTLELASAQS